MLNPLLTAEVWRLGSPAQRPSPCYWAHLPLFAESRAPVPITSSIASLDLLLCSRCISPDIHPQERHTILSCRLLFDRVYLAGFCWWERRV